MAIKVVKDEKKCIEVEVVGRGHTLCNSIRREIYNDKGDVVAGYSIEHPLINDPKLIVRSDKPKKTVLNAVDRLKSKNKELRGKLKKI